MTKQEVLLVDYVHFVDDFQNCISIKLILFINSRNRGEIQLESNYIEPGKNIGLHIFEQLLMIFVDGLKYFYSNENNKVDISQLDMRNIEKINKYFISMNYFVNLDIYPTMYDYKFVFPDYFKNQKYIKSETKLEDFF